MVRVDGKGVPLLKAAAVKRKAKLGPGANRPQQKDALVGVRDPVDATPRAPEALAARLGDAAAARARRQREGLVEDAPRAQQVRRLASLVRTTPAVRACMKADAERREPQHGQPLVVWLAGALGRWSLAPQRCKEWRRVTVVLDSRHVVGSLWSAAHAWCGEGAQAGNRWGQAKRADILRGRVGYVIGGRRQILTQRRRRQSVWETRKNVITCFHHHRRWMQSNEDLAMGLPVGTGVVESACGAVVKPRMEGEGQRWSLDGAEARLAWRSRKKSHHTDLRADWRCRARQERARL